MDTKVKFINCTFIQTDKPSNTENNNDLIKVTDGDTFDNCTFYVPKNRAAINILSSN
jgi:hypothetical protein